MISIRNEMVSIKTLHSIQETDDFGLFIGLHFVSGTLRYGDHYRENAYLCQNRERTIENEGQ